MFEAALGLALVTCAATGALGADDFPHPVGGPAVAVVGALLLLVGGVLWFQPLGLAALAGGNLATAVAAEAWLGVASGFSGAGTAVLDTTAAVLVGLAVAQLATLRR